MLRAETGACRAWSAERNAKYWASLAVPLSFGIRGVNLTARVPLPCLLSSPSLFSHHADQRKPYPLSSAKKDSFGFSLEVIDTGISSSSGSKNQRWRSQMLLRLPYKHRIVPLKASGVLTSLEVLHGYSPLHPKPTYTTFIGLNARFTTGHQWSRYMVLSLFSKVPLPSGFSFKKWHRTFIILFHPRQTRLPRPLKHHWPSLCRHAYTSLAL